MRIFDAVCEECKQELDVEVDAFRRILWVKPCSYCIDAAYAEGLDAEEFSPRLSCSKCQTPLTFDRDEKDNTFSVNPCEGCSGEGVE